MIRPYDNSYSIYNTDLNNNFLLNNTGIKDYLNNKTTTSSSLEMTNSLKLKTIIENENTDSISLKEIKPTFEISKKSKISNNINKPIVNIIKDNITDDVIRPYSTEKNKSEDNNYLNINSIDENKIQNVETKIPTPSPQKDSHKELILFYADWCGYSKQFYPIWEKIKNKPSNKKYNFREVESKNRDIKKYNINAFPTILFVDHNIDFELLYNGNRTEEDIEAFLYNVFNIEKETNKQFSELDITNIELNDIPLETSQPFVTDEIIPTEKINLMDELSKKLNESNNNIYTEKTEKDTLKEDDIKIIDDMLNDVIKKTFTKEPESQVINKESVKQVINKESVKLVKPVKSVKPVKPVKLVINKEFEKIINKELAKESAKQVINKENKKVELILFYADWCGYSKKFLPIWKSIIPELKKRQVIYRMVDSTRDDELKKYNIDGFPTLIYVNHDLNIKILYDGIRNKEGVLSFIDNILNKNDEKVVNINKNTDKIIFPEFKPVLKKNTLSDIINNEIDNVLTNSEVSFNKMDKTSTLIIIILSVILLNYLLNYISNLLTDLDIIKDIDQIRYIEF